MDAKLTSDRSGTAPDSTADFDLRSSSIGSPSSSAARETSAERRYVSRGDGTTVHSDDLLHVALDNKGMLTLEIRASKEPIELGFAVRNELSELSSGKMDHVLSEHVDVIRADDGVAGKQLTRIELAGETLAEIRFDPETMRLDVPDCGRELRGFDLRQFNRLGELFIPSWKSISPDPRSLYQPVIDLHTHYAGQVSTEALFKVAAENNSPYPLSLLSKIGIRIPEEHPAVTPGQRSPGIGFADLLTHLSDKPDDLLKLRSAFSVPPGKIIPHVQLSAIYEYRRPLMHDLRTFAPLLREIAAAYRETGVEYAELSFASITKPEYLAEAHRVLPEIEKETGVRLRFLAGLNRCDEPEQIKAYIEQIKFAASRSPYVVGADFMGHEKNSSKALAEHIKDLAAYRDTHQPDFIIRVHAGENPLYPENVREAIKAGANRIGHGIYGGTDPETLELARQRNVTIEFNGVSNQALNNINAADLDGLSKELPYLDYIEGGVRITLSSDGGPTYGGGGGEESYTAAFAGVTADHFDSIEANDRAYLADRREREEKRLAARPSLLTAPAPDEFPPLGWSREQAAEAKEAKRMRAAAIEKDLQSKGVKLVTREELEGPELAGLIPIVFSGASRDSWDKISGTDQEKWIESFETLAAGLDKDKVILVTGGTHHGVEAVVHTTGRELGYKILGTVSESTSGKIEPGTITHGVMFGRNWYEQAGPLIEWVKERGGAIVYVDGGNIVKDSIQAAVNVGARFFLMKGPAGAADEKAALFPDRAFSGETELLERVRSELNA